VLDSGWNGSEYNNDSEDEANSEEYGISICEDLLV
jgi:hypothetical protein